MEFQSGRMLLLLLTDFLVFSRGVLRDELHESLAASLRVDGAALLLLRVPEHHARHLPRFPGSVFFDQLETRAFAGGGMWRPLAHTEGVA